MKRTRAETRGAAPRRRLAPPPADFLDDDLDGMSDLPDVNAVVKVFAIHADPNYALPWSLRHQGGSTSTGFAIRGPRGEKCLLTNAHSVEHPAVVQVRRRGGDEKFVAKVLCVGIDCDLALLSVDDPRFWKGLEPLEFAPELPRLREEVTVVGYPVGGDSFCVTKGVVSRIDITQYVHGAHKLLAVQIDAAINPGNSGGPALDDAKRCIGIAFQSLKDGQTENCGYIVPSEVALHFLEQYARTGAYEGFGYFGFAYQQLENPTMRKFLKMPAGAMGVLVKKIEPTAPCAKVLKVGDIVTSVGGRAVANDGTVLFQGGERISFNYEINRRFVGDKCPLVVLRNGKQTKVNVVAGRKTPLVPLDVPKKPEYLIVGGIVFVPLTEPFLRCEYGDEYEWDTPARLLTMLQSGEVKEKGHQIVLISQVLASELTIGFTELRNVQVAKFNDQPVMNLKQLCASVEKCTAEYMRFELQDRDTVVLRTKEAKAALAGILQANMINKYKSDGL